MALKHWWEIAIPHKDIREGRLADFAADLSSVLKGEGSLDYIDPEIFFRRTYLTKGLENLIKEILLILSGREGSRVIQLQTPFGGGKTHALVALYHLLKEGEQLSEVAEIKNLLESCGLEEIPKAEVAAFVGTVPDPLAGKTPWGEIAEQLGAYEEVKEHDQKRITPGREILEGILKSKKPVLILIDELTEYIVKAKEFEDAVFAFCHELTEAVNSQKQCALVCTLPSSAPYGERGERVLSQLARIFGRMKTIYTPVEGEEIYEILRKRLFADCGDVKIHMQVARQYFELYQNLGDEVPRECREISYLEKMEKSYPFHPELVDMLFERWGTLPTFQRTRGVLQLLATVVHDLFIRQYPVPVIQPAHVNLASPQIRRLFIEHIGEVFESVIGSDISGDNAKAVILDRHMGSEYARFNVANGLATSIFLYSFSGGERKGLTPQKLRLAFLREGIPPAIVGDALRRLEGELWYLHFDEKNNLYYFSSTVGLNKVIIDKEEAINEEDILAEIRKRMEKMAGEGFDVYIWPKASEDIPDNKKLKLVILPLDLTASEERTKSILKEFIHKHGVEFRSYKNTLVFLIADENEFEALKTAARRFLALKEINEEEETFKSLTEMDRGRLEQKLKESDETVSLRVLSTYRHLAVGSQDGVQIFDMGIPSLGERLNLCARAKDFLRDQEILLSKISPKAMLDKAFSEEDKEKSVSEIVEAFHKYPGLPILESEAVLKSAIAEGVREGAFGLSKEERIVYGQAIPVEEIPKDALVIKKEEIEKLIIKKEEIEKTESLREAPPAGVEVEAKREPSRKEVIRRYILKFSAPWGRLSDILGGVFMPLNSDGAEISLRMEIEAESKEGIGKDTIDLKVKETLKQIGAQILEEKEEKE